MSMRFRRSRLLEGSVDIEAVVANVPEAFTVKGMFFMRALTILGDDYAPLKSKLRAPTERYLPFRNYPQADHGRLVFHAATKRAPRQSHWEALRRFARHDVEDFAASMLGRVTLSMVGDPKKVLSLMPGVYDKVAPGPWGFAVHDDGNQVTVNINRITGPWSYQLGQIEGAIGFYHASAEVEVQPNEPGVRFIIRFD
ncbi:MAG: DUF2378 family protein [Myxococcota bacterium]